MDPSHIPATGHGPAIVASPLQIRRAVLAVLLDAPEPVGLSDVVVRLDREHGIDLARQWSQRSGPRTVQQRLSDLVRWQVRAGRVRRVARATFVAVPSSMSASTRWRCRNWRRIADREVRGR